MESKDKKNVCFYHGTHVKNLNSIKKKGLLITKGIEGFNGVFLDNDEDMAWEWGYAKYTPEKEKITIIRVCLSPKETQFLTPDYNFADYPYDPKKHKNNPYYKQNGIAWNHPSVSSVIWNDKTNKGISPDHLEICDIHHLTKITLEKCKNWKPILKYS